MRISADPANLDYKPEAHRAIVYFDGVERKDVITADEERGCIICLARDKCNNILIDQETGEPQVVMLSGTVKVELA